MLKNCLISACLLGVSLSTAAMDETETSKKDKAAGVVQRAFRNCQFQKNSFKDMYAQGLSYRDGKVEGYEKGSFFAEARAGAHFLPLAREGDAKAQHNLAMVYYRRSNYEAALNWLRKASDQGFGPSTRNLEKLVKETKRIRLFYDVFLHIASYLDDNSLLGFRSVGREFAGIAETAFRNRALIKTPLACLSSRNKIHPYPHTMSYFIRRRLDQTRLVFETERFDYKKCAAFCEEWGFLASYIFHSKSTYHIERDAGCLNEFYRILKGYDDVDALELKMWLLTKSPVAVSDHDFDPVRQGFNPVRVLDLTKKIMNQKREEVGRYYLEFFFQCLTPENQAKLRFLWRYLNGDQVQSSSLWQRLTFKNKHETLLLLKSHYQSAADEGDADSQYRLGALLQGEGKISEAREYYQRAADKGFIPARRHLQSLSEREK